MMNIYAKTFMTATRTDLVQLQEVPSVADQKSRRWFPRRKTRYVDLKKL